MQDEDGVTSRSRLVGLSSLVLVLGIVLGMIAMHSTPAMGMSHDMRSAGASSPSAAQALSKARPMMHSAETPVVAFGEARIANDNVNDSGPAAPSRDHMLKPCLSDSTRSLHASVVASAAIGMPARAGRTVTVMPTPASQPRRHPPDLHELCISRT